MIIKCFKVGGTAFSLGDGQSMPHMGRTVAAEVVKVGRKYVTVLLNGQEVRFYTPYKCGPYLMEDKNWGVPRLLFPTNEMASRYREREELKSWVAEETDCLKIDRYSLEQLRGVKQISEHIRSEGHPLTPRDGYQKLPQKAALILQPKDWATSEWTTLCRVYGLPADRTAEIRLHVSEIECFTAACGTDMEVPAGFLDEPRKDTYSVSGELLDGHNLAPLTEPFIWEPEDWTFEEWAVLCKLCDLPAEQTRRILLRAGEIEYFLNPCNERSSPRPVPGRMTEEEMDTFKALFRYYCRQEINEGHCDSDSCEFCSVDQAYNKIFSKPANDENDDE